MTGQQPARRRRSNALAPAPLVGCPDDVTSMMDIDDVARRLATSVRHIRRLVLERRIAHYKVGGKLRFDRIEIEAWVAAARVPAEPDIEFSAPAVRRSGSSQHRPLRQVPARTRRRDAS